MRRLALACGVLSCAAVAAFAHAAPPPSFLESLHSLPAQTSPRPAVHRPTGTSAWTPLALYDHPGRTRCASLVNGGSSVVVGADEAGYWVPGPFGWEPRGDELGGGVTHMISGYAPPTYQNERVVVVRSRDSQLLYSDDQGATWAPCVLPDGFLIQRVKRLLSDGNFNNVKYLVGYGTNPVQEEDQWLVARSFDSGASWEALVTDCCASNLDLWTSRVPPSRQLYVRDDGSDLSFESWEDLGDSRTSLFDAAGSGSADDLSITGNDASPGKLWFFAHSELYQHDGVDLTWYGQPTQNAFQTGTLAGGVLTPDHVMFADDRYVYQSPDGGSNVTVFPTDQWSYDFDSINDRPTAVQCLSPVEFPPASAAGTAGGVLRFADPNGRHDAIGARPASVTGALNVERYYISTGAGTYTYEPGDEFTMPLTDGSLQNLQVEDFSSFDGPTWRMSVAARDQGVLELAGNDLPLDVIGGVSTYPNDNGSVAQNRLPVATDPYRLTQFGFGLSLVGNGVFSGTAVPGNSPSGGWRSLTADPDVNARWYWCDDRVYRLDYVLATNTFTTTGIGPSIPPIGAFLGHVVAPSNAQVRYSATTGIGFGPEVYRTTNNWTSWTQASGGILHPDPEHVRVAMAVHPTNPDECVIGGLGVIRTTNGTVFSDYSQGLPVGTKVFDLAYQGDGSSTLWAATDRGAFRNSGAGWVDLSPPGSGVPDVPFHAVEAVPAAQAMRFGTYGRGLWEYTTSPVSGVPGADRPALALAPSSNPMRGTGRVSFSLPEPGRVRMDMLDIGGRRVATLVDADLEAGTHSVRFDVRRLSAGVYFARLVTGHGERSVKLVVAH